MCLSGTFTALPMKQSPPKKIKFRVKGPVEGLAVMDMFYSLYVLLTAAKIPHGATKHLKLNVIILRLLATVLESAALDQTPIYGKQGGNKRNHGQATSKIQTGEIPQKQNKNTISSTNKLQWVKRREAEGESWDEKDS